MKFNRIFLVGLLLFAIFMIGTASASDDVANLTDESLAVDDNGIEEVQIDTDSAEEQSAVEDKTFNDIQTLVDSAEENSTISLDGVYKSQGYIINVSKSLTIDGNNRTTLDGNHLSGVLNIYKPINIVLKNLKVINSNGTALFLNNQRGKVIIDNCQFVNNYAYGTAAIFSYVSVDISNCLFENNSAYRNGIISLSGVNNTLINNNFTNNSAEDSVGAVKIYERNSKVINNIFKNNRAIKTAALHFEGDDGLIQNCVFENNVAKIFTTYYSGECGALRVLGKNVALKDSLFRYNVAAGQAGAIWWEGNDGLMVNVTLENNTASYGGGLYIMGHNLNVFNSTFANNLNKDFGHYCYGAAIYCFGSNASLVNCHIFNNVGPDAVYWSGNNGLVNNSVFENNRGGTALYDYEGHNLTILNSNFTKNHNQAIHISASNAVLDNLNIINNSQPDNFEGYSGATAISISGYNATVSNSNIINNTGKESAVSTLGRNHNFTNCNFINNTAWDDCGGAIAFVYGVIDGCNFTNNKARQGGAIYVLASSDLAPDLNKFVIKNSLFINNSATVYEGGAISSIAHGACIVNSTFINNTAKCQGGGLYSYAYENFIENNTFINNSAQIGGGVYIGYLTTHFKNITLENNVAQTFNDVYGKFNFELTKQQFYYGEDITVKVTDNLTGQIIKGDYFNFNLNGQDFYDIKTDSNGILKIHGLVAKGNYSIFVSNNYDIKSLYFTDVSFVEAPSKITPAKSQKYGEKLTVTLTNTALNSKISGVKLALKAKVNGKYKTIYATTNSKGVATFDTSKWNAGSYSVEFTSADANAKASKVTGKLTIAKLKATVSAPKVTFKVKKSKYFKATVKVSKKPLKSVYVKVKIDKKTYKVKTNSKGIVKINTKKLKIGKHKVVISSGNSNYKISAKSLITIKK